MIGRGAIGNPWIFEHTKYYLETGKLLPKPTLQDRLELTAEQLRKSVPTKVSDAGHHQKKHYGQYLKGMRNGKKLRQNL